MAKRPEPKGAKPPLPGLMKLQLLYENSASPVNSAANIHHFIWADRVNHPQADLLNLLPNLVNVWSTTVWNHFDSEWKITGAVLSSLGGDGLEATSVPNVAGGSLTGAMPPQCAICVSWSSSLTARGGRGRTYVPGVPTDALVQTMGSAVKPTVAAAIQASGLSAHNQWDLLAVGGVGISHVIVSYYYQYQLRAVPLTASIFAVKVHQRVDSQRRRSGKESVFAVS